MRRLGLVALLLCLSAMALAQKVAILYPGDVLVVQVFGNDAYSGEFPVLRDGAITGPGFDRIVAQGKTIEQVRAIIVARLKRYIRKPLVSVFVKIERMNFIYVSGAKTQNPQGILYIPDMDLRQVIGAVELPSDSDLLQATVFRHNEKPVRVALKDLMHPGDVDSDVMLKPNDMVDVEPLDFVRVWVTGVVKMPGYVRVQAGSDAYQAISQSGGVDFAELHQEDVQIHIRRGLGTIALPAHQDLNAPPIPLEAGDVVVVTKPNMIRITVGGEVKIPGEVQLRETESIVTAVSRAGGLTPLGGLHSVLVLRKGEAFQVDVGGPQIAKNETQFALQDGDTIYVRQNQRFVVVVGTVQRSGRFMMDEDKTYHLADALAIAGGLTAQGTLRRVCLARADADGRFAVTKYNLDEFLKDGKMAANPPIQSGDIVLFTEPKGFTAAQLIQVLAAASILAQILPNIRN